MAIVGYARVSSTDQDLEGQVTQLRTAGCAKVFQEQASGARGDRPQLSQMLSYVREGDVLVVTKLDRLARSMVDFWRTWEQLRARDVGLRVLNVEGLNTATPTGQLIMGVLAAVAQFERELIRERQAEGIARAKQAGKYTGRQPLPPEVVAKVRELAALGVPKARIARQLKVGRTSVYAYLSQ
jgi:DNA invertase Pin-like site-specific DNA recombinase